MASLATAALILLTLVASLVVASRPARFAQPGKSPAFLTAPSGIRVTPATPAAASGPAEFLWETNGGPDARIGLSAGAAVDAQGNVWVTDGHNGRIVIFSPEGAVLETWGTKGSGEGEFNFTCQGLGYGGVAFDVAGNIYVADAGNERIQKFAPDRTFLTSWLSEGIVDSQLLVTGRGNTQSTATEPLCLAAITIDGQGRVFVSERTAGEIQIFDPEGRLLATATVENLRPEGIALDSHGNLWVADNADRVLQFSPRGDMLAVWDDRASGDWELSSPMAIAVDGQDQVYVTDWSNRVQVFAPDGAFLGAWGGLGMDEGQFNDPVGLAVDDTGHIFVIEHFGRVQAFRLLPPLVP